METRDNTPTNVDPELSIELEPKTKPKADLNTGIRSHTMWEHLCLKIYTHMKRS